MNDAGKRPQAVIGWIERDTPFAASPAEVRQAMDSQLELLAKRNTPLFMTEEELAARRAAEAS